MPAQKISLAESWARNCMSLSPSLIRVNAEVDWSRRCRPLITILRHRRVSCSYSHRALVGSQQVRRFSLKPSKVRMSSSVIAKSKTSAFSRMREELADLGMTTKLCWIAQRIRICAVDLVPSSREAPGIKESFILRLDVDSEALGYLFATATSFRSLRRSP